MGSRSPPGRRSLDCCARLKSLEALAWRLEALAWRLGLGLEALTLEALTLEALAWRRGCGAEVQSRLSAFNALPSSGVRALVLLVEAKGRMGKRAAAGGALHAGRALLCLPRSARRGLLGAAVAMAATEAAEATT